MAERATGEEAAKDLRWAVWWNIVNTNLIGMPVLLFFILLIMGSLSRWTNVVRDWSRDPYFIIVNFIILVTISASFVVGHYYWVIRVLGPAEKYLSLTNGTDPEELRASASSALYASETLPYRAMFWSCVFYTAGAFAAVGALQFTYCFALRQIVAMIMAIAATGWVISIFQFYKVRKRLLEFQEEILADFPDLMLTDAKDKWFMEINLGGKFTGALLFLVFMSIVTVGVAFLSGANRGYKRQLGTFYLNLLEPQKPMLSTMVQFRVSGSNIKEHLKKYVIDKERDKVFLVDEDFNSRLDEEVPEDFKRVMDVVVRGVKDPLEFRRPTIHTLVPGKIYSVMMGASEYSLVRVDISDESKDLEKWMREEEGRAEGPQGSEASMGTEEEFDEGAAPETENVETDIESGYSEPADAARDDEKYLAPKEEPEAGNSYLFVATPYESYSYAVNEMLWLVVPVLIVLPLFAVRYAGLASAEIRDPIVSLMGSLGAMAEGDLTRNVTVTGRDEMGILSRSVASAIFGLRRLLGRMEEAAHALDDAAGAIQSEGDEMSEGSRTQVSLVDETSRTMGVMKESVGGIADSVQTLASSAEESSASILEVQATIDEVGLNVENLSAAVEQTTAAIQEMNTSTREVAENVQYLSRRSQIAMDSLGEMERMISRVNSGSSETASLSGRVAQDAEKGARAVNLTIDGIQKIRDTSGGVSQVISELGARAAEIGNILNVIEDVTDETNLLALNAAIIAAQAGEHGRGFSVVADEIKDLAERTAASTKEIADLIDAVQGGAQLAVLRMKEGTQTIEEGVKRSEQAGDALIEIQDSARKSMEQTHAIAEAAKVQAKKSSEFLEFMDGLNAMITQAAQATQEQTKSGDQIASTAAKMEDIAQQVKRATLEQAQGSRQITQAIEHIAEITGFINLSQGEQLKSTDEVSNAVGHIKSVADDNQLRVEKMMRTVANLKSMANGLRELLGEFNLDSD